jgi:YidC/Oxa1 family membrane protein insertase
MFESFFSLFIWPIQAMIQVLFLFFMKAFAGNPGLTIIVISLVVNSLLLPIYLVADRWQSEERSLLGRMRAKVADIGAVFRGDERQMVLNTYYRQMGYHPLFSIRSSIGLLIQIPFFLAAYDFFSHSPALPGASFLFLSDLGRPDALLTLGGVTLNVLPFVMTFFNLLSAFLYTKGLETRDKVQLVVLASIFLVLLYGSPSGLVLYWTVSNLFSLGKNASLGLRQPGRWFHGIAVLGVLLATVLPAMGLWGPRNLKMVALGLGVAAAFGVAPWAWKQLAAWSLRRRSLGETQGDLGLLVWSAGALTLLTGLVIPALLVSSSPTEFNHIWVQLGQTSLQAAGLFLVIPLAVWALSNQPLKRLLVPGMVVVLLWALLNCFLFPNPGTLTASFDFTDAGALSGRFDRWTTAFGFVLALGTVAVLWKFGRRSWIRGVLTIATIALASTGLVTLATVAKVPELPPVPARHSVEPVFHLSKTQPNVFFVFLDRAVGAALPDALERAPDLKGALEGFVYYPNTLSFGQCTILGAEAMFGGYDYTPDAINSRSDKLLVDKVDASLKVLPGIFGQAGYRVSLTDPAYAGLSLVPPDLSIFQSMPNVTATNIKGQYKTLYYKEMGLNPDDQPVHHRSEFDLLLRFSLFRMAPPLARPLIYSDGGWMQANKGSHDFDTVMDSYANLHFLPQLSVADSSQPTFNLFDNETTHDNGGFDYTLKPSPWDISIPASDLSHLGEKFDAVYLYNYTASLESLAQWFRWLHAQGLWDSTKIVIASDHGVSYRNHGSIQDGFEKYNPLLLVKDFGSSGPLRTDGRFMTNADVPVLLTSSLGRVSDPNTGKALTMEGKDGTVLVHYGPSMAPPRDSVNLKFEQSWELTEKSIFTKDGWKPVP